MKHQTQQGLWLFEEGSLRVSWVGSNPPPVMTLKERIWFVYRYILSNGYGPTIIDLIQRSAKALAFILKPSQVSLQGKSYDTTGLSIEDDWHKFNLNS